MNDNGSDAATQSAKRDRSPAFPYIGLSRALERTAQLLAKAKRSEVRIVDAAGAWGMGLKSSATLQTTAALLAYGLLEDSGSGENRKIKVSELGRRILEDLRPGVKEEAMKVAALKPPIIREMASHWSGGRPDDNICISELKFDRHFTEEGARIFLRVFDDTIGFARAENDDTAEHKHEDTPPPPLSKVAVGDHVQWTSNGVDQFEVARKVVEINSEGFAFLQGNPGGVPVSELSVVDAPKRPRVTPRSAEGTSQRPDINVYQTGDRLQITAEVDLAGLQRLKELLEKYEGILEIMTGSQLTK